MQESKYQVKHWKKWKATSYLLKQTKNELMNDIKAISYSNDLPGGSHKTVVQKYNELIENVKSYDEHIRAYDVMINRLETAITTLLTEEQIKAIVIYSNGKNSAQREQDALEKGISSATYYRLTRESFNILDKVLNKVDSNLIVK